MSKLLAMMMKPKNYMYATIKGSLTENDGVFSGFSSSNYLELQQPFTLNADTVAEIVIKTNVSSFTDGRVLFGTYGDYGISLNLRSDRKFRLYIGDNSSSWNILSYLETDYTFSTNTDYYIKISFNRGVCSILYSTDNINYVSVGTATLSLSGNILYNLTYGIGRVDTSYFTGTIDLNQSYIKINNTKYQLQAVVGYTVVGSPTITDGVVSGFSSSDKLKTSIETIDTTLQNTIFQVKFTTGENITSAQYTIFYSTKNGSMACGLGINSNGKISWVVGKETNTNTQYIITSNYTVSANTTYWIKGSAINGIATLQYSVNGINWINGGSSQYQDLLLSNTFGIGAPSHTSTYRIFNGSIDIPNCYIKINNKLWFNGQPAE